MKLTLHFFSSPLKKEIFKFSLYPLLLIEKQTWWWFRTELAWCDFSDDINVPWGFFLPLPHSFFLSPPSFFGECGTFSLSMPRWLVSDWDAPVTGSRKICFLWDVCMIGGGKIYWAQKQLRCHCRIWSVFEASLQHHHYAA